MGVSKRRFAELSGRQEKEVRRKVASGHLPVLDDGSIDPALAEAFGKSATRRTKATAKPAVAAADKNADNPALSAQAMTAITVAADDDETLEEAAKRLTPSLMSQFKTKADAEVVKETYLALLRKLEFDEKSGEVVRVAEVSKIVGNEYAKVRSKLMEIPSAVAPLAVLMKSPEEVRSLIEKEIAHALEELAYDGNLSATT